MAKCNESDAILERVVLLPDSEMLEKEVFGGGTIIDLLLIVKVLFLRLLDVAPNVLKI